MKNVKIPEDCQQITPYLIVENAPAFIQFTQNVFDSSEKSRVMRDEDTIMHAEIRIGDAAIMLADATEEYKVQTAGLFIYVDDCDTIHQKALDNSAIQIMPPANQQYGRSSGVKDPFGITWWITSV